MDSFEACFMTNSLLEDVAVKQVNFSLGLETFDV